MAKDNKRKYKEKLDSQLLKHDDFLIEKLSKEWDIIQKTAKREKIVRQAKESGIMVAKLILGLVVVAGVLSIAVVAPNIFSIFGRSPFRRGFFEKKNIKEGIRYLKRRKYINVVSDSQGRMEVSVTIQGKKTVLKNAFDGVKIVKQPQWDGIWRIIAFDIPDKYKWSRDGFRKKLKMMGLYQMQESVFITPYACEKEIRFITFIYDVARYSRFVETKRMDDEDLREFFGFDV